MFCLSGLDWCFMHFNCILLSNLSTQFRLVCWYCSFVSTITHIALPFIWLYSRFVASFGDRWSSLVFGIGGTSTRCSARGSRSRAGTRSFWTTLGTRSRAPGRLWACRPVRPRQRRSHGSLPPSPTSRPARRTIRSFARSTNKWACLHSPY